MRRVLLLMLPVTISLGLINFNLLINSFFGSLVTDEGAGGDRQGVPHLPAAAGDLLGGDRDRALPDPGPLRRRAASIDNLRATMANGMRQILFVLLPAAAAILVLSEPMIRLVYQRGEFTPGRDDPGRHGALLVRLLAADQRPLPAADPDLLQPPAALDGDRRSPPIDLVVSALARARPLQAFGVGGIVAGDGDRRPRPRSSPRR